MDRLAEEEILKHITTTDAGVQRPQALDMLRSWFVQNPRPTNSRGTRPVVRSSSPSPNPGQPGSSEAEGVQLDLTRSAVLALQWLTRFLLASALALHVP